MTSTRLAALSAAFREVPLTCGPLQLRPVTAGSIDILMETRNPLFVEGPADEHAEARQIQGLYQFIWIHSAPEDEVVEACGNPAILQALARKLSLSIGFDDLAEFSEKFALLRDRLNAAVVEIVPEKGMGKPGGETPRTGSPLSSIPSAAAQTLPANTGFSGVSRFPEPSNTCTPPTARPEPPPAGKSPIWEAPDEQWEDWAIPGEVMPLP